MRRRWQVWALYEEPVLVQRCWTRWGARDLAYRMHQVTSWLDYEVRDDGSRQTRWQHLLHRHRFEVAALEEHVKQDSDGMWRVTCGWYACYGMRTEMCECGKMRLVHACWDQERYL